MTQPKKKMSRRASILLWLGSIGIIIGILIYLEQIAILYVLATVALVALLTIVSLSDLEGVDRANIQNDV
jgi:hypothetical protein